MFEVIQRNLVPNREETQYDKTTFEKYHNGIITLEQCRQRFFENNGIPEEDRMRINLTLFYSWICSLGYER